MDGFVQVFPQLVGEAGGAVVAVGLAAALGGIQAVFHGGDDLGDIDAVGRLGQYIAAAGTAHAFDQAGAPQLVEQLLEIGERNLLALADGVKFDCAAGGVHSQIQHGGYGKAAFGR